MVVDRALAAGEGLNFNQPNSNHSPDQQAVPKWSLSKEDAELLGGMWVRIRARCFSISPPHPAGMLPGRTAEPPGGFCPVLPAWVHLGVEDPWRMALSLCRFSPSCLWKLQDPDE